jgi:hypothetical protein
MALLAACASSARRKDGDGPEVVSAVRVLPLVLCPPLSEAHQQEVQASRSTLVAPEKLEGDRLLAAADYRGGCGAHDFKVCASEFVEGSPVQAQVEIIHRSDDRCERPIREWLAIDLANLKTTYRRVYRTQAGAILLTFPNGEWLYQFGR